MEQRHIPVHQSLHRHNLVLGAERELAMTSALIALLVGVGGMTAISGLAALLFCLPLTQWCKNRLESWVVQDGRGQGRQALVSIGTAMMNVALLLVCTALLVGDSYNPFLYFRF